MGFWRDMKKEFPEFGRRNFLVLGIRGGLYLAPRFERSVRNESDVWFRDTRGNFIYPDRVLAWAEVPPFDMAQADDERLDTLEAKAQADAEYISELEQLVKELKEENTRLRSCLSDDAENARQILGESAKLRELVAQLIRCARVGKEDVSHYQPTRDGCGFDCVANGEHCSFAKICDHARAV